MPILLSLECSTSVCSAALHQDGQLITQKEVHTPQAAASQLSQLIDENIRTSGISKSHLSGVAVAYGPGSYTGLRIGLATAKGICYGLDIPLITLDSLHIMASSIKPVGDGRWLCPMIDARRMEVYVCLLTEDLRVIQPTRPVILDETSFAKELTDHPIAFFGNGAAKCEPVISSPRATFIQGVYPRAADMGMLAFNKFEQGEFADVRTVEPLYLKEFLVKTKSS